MLFIAWKTAPGWDEWGHLPAGLFSLQYGEFSPYCVNPPLTRLWCTLPVWLTGGGIDYQQLPMVAGLRNEGILGYAYVNQWKEQTFFWMSLARTAAIPIAVLGTYLIWIVGKRLFSPCSAICAAILWVFSPTVLTFGASITPDVSSAVFGLLTSWRFYIWLRIGSFYNALLLGGSLALAMLSKATWLILPIILVFVTALYAWRHRKKWSWSNRGKQIAIVAGVTWIAIHACYDFRGMLRPLGEFEFISQTLMGIDATSSSDQKASGNRFRNSWAQNIPAPLPADFIRGIDIQKHDFESKMNSYFWGVTRDHGWWYYYLVGIWLKEPVALWILVVAGLFLRLLKKRNSCSKTRKVSQSILLLPGVAVLFLVSSQTGFNHHLRYVLPFLPCFYLLVSQPIAWFSSKGKYITAGLLVWYAFSSISVLPRSYAYFTEVVGGPENGWKYLSDSNLDWGQDLLTAKQWIQNNPDKRPVYLIYSMWLISDFHKLGIDAKNGRKYIEKGRPTKPGYWVVFARPMLEDKFRWFHQRSPSIKLSVTTSIYEVHSEMIRDQVDRSASRREESNE